MGNYLVLSSRPTFLASIIPRSDHIFECNLLIVRQIQASRILLQALVIHIDGALEEAKGFGSIAGSPFLTRLFQFNAG